MRNLRLSHRVILCVLFLLLLAATANAQFKAGIQGTVKDTAGGLVAEAKITLTNTETGKTQETTAGGEGFYKGSGRAPGKYKLHVKKSRSIHKHTSNIHIA